MFIKDIEKFIESKNAEGHETLLNLDANEQWEEEDSKIREMALRLGLYYIAKERFPGGIPPTYTRTNSESRIDLMLGSEKVLENTIAYGMAPEDFGLILGDHIAQYIDINIKNFLNLNQHDVGSPTGRRLKSSDPKCAKKYINKPEKNYENHNIHKRVENLWNALKIILQ